MEPRFPGLAAAALALCAAAFLGACKPAASGAAAEGAPLPTGAATRPAPIAATFPPPSCTVQVDGPVNLKSGQAGTARVTLRPTGGYHVNQEAPFELVVASNEARLPRGKFGFADAQVLAPEEVRLDVPFHAGAAGASRLSVHARMGICSDARCAECRQVRDLVTQVD